MVGIPLKFVFNENLQAFLHFNFNKTKQQLLNYEISCSKKKKGITFSRTKDGTASQNGEWGRKLPTFKEADRTGKLL